MALTLNNINSGYNLSAINDNFQTIEEYINNKLLARAQTGIAGEAMMERDLDMNGHNILNLATDLSQSNGLITVGQADLRYYNITGDVLEGNLNAGGFQLKNLAKGTGSLDAARILELDAETAARQGADANIQAQLTGNVPLESSAFSQISWHDQVIPNSVTVPANKNAWSFGPQIEIVPGQLVTVGAGSTWTIANGRVVESSSLHNLIADTITTSDGNTSVSITDIPSKDTTDSLTARITAEETKIQPVALGGTGNASGIAPKAISLNTARTIQTNLASTSSVSFDGTANITPGVTGTLPIANGGTGAVTASAARTALGAAASAGVTDASSAASGVVGEYLIIDIGGSPVSLTSGSAANITSLTLTPGDWIVSGYLRTLPAAGTTITSVLASPSTTSLTNGSPSSRVYMPLTFPTGVGPSIQLGVTRFNVSVSTTIYLVSTCVFSGSTCTAEGGINARRIR